MESVVRDSQSTWVGMKGIGGTEGGGGQLLVKLCSVQCNHPTLFIRDIRGRKREPHLNFQLCLQRELTYNLRQNDGTQSVIGMGDLWCPP